MLTTNMKKIKISHEVPFCLLTKSREFNDYDYCLPHLMDENEEYRNFFYESKKMGRYIVMDNSLHELGEAYNSKRLMHWVNEIEPNEFIVPDVWEDYAASIKNAKLWSYPQLPANTTKVAVVQAKNIARYIIMDNSLHELGEAYDSDRLMYWINKLEPDEFIVPDVWEDYAASVRNAKQWATVEMPANTTKVAVVQAKSYHEAVLCTQAYKDFGYKKIAYSYGASYYNDICPHPNKDLGKAIGRYMVIYELYKQNVLSMFDRVHLLGTASPIEFGMYKNIDCIESIDTSNPIMAAIGEMPYTKMGLHMKPLANMNKYQDMSKDFVNEDLVEYNVEMFRQINGL